ncbi:MAG: ASKHA domain-containing protein [Pseudomonadota bacterium]
MIAAGKGYVRTVVLRTPELGNNTADVERLKAALYDALKTRYVRIPTALIRSLPRDLRQWHHKVTCVVFRIPGLPGWELVDILAPLGRCRVLGVAVDIGTTRVVVRLLDLERGEALKETGFDNPQSVIGPDVLTRIHYAKTPGGLDRLQSLIIQGLNACIGDLCRDADVDSAQVYLVVGAGNTAMTHLFLGIDPEFMIREPYIPAVNGPETLDASELKILIHPRGRVFLLPNIGSYFGGDLIAGILFAGLHRRDEYAIMVDVGTNAEVVVGNRDWLIACAGAAGPALEGGVSAIGMTAGPGVIDRVSIDPRTLAMDFHTIGDLPPVGICGSGMIDLAAQLFLSGMLDIRGKFSLQRCASRLARVQGIDCLTLVDRTGSGTGQDIVLTQVDMNSLTSAKAAMYSILEVIVQRTAGLSFEDLSRFYVAGTFGSFINPRSAIAIGMLPDIALETFEVIGNSSLEGASMLLLNPDAMDEIESIRSSITYLELNVNAEFMTLFSGAKFYPHTDRSRFPSVPVYDSGSGSSAG